MSARTLQRRRMRRSRQRGVLLGVVMVLLAILFTAGLFALWSMRNETSSAGQDRLSRQLFDCAEQGLAWGKQYYSKMTSQLRDQHLAASNLCSAAIAPTNTPLPCFCTNTPLPCSPSGPFPTGGTGTPPANFPNQPPYTQGIVVDNRRGAGNYDFQYTVAIYNNPGEGPFHDADGKLIVYSQCVDLQTLQTRAVQALIKVIPGSTSDYTGQAGRGFRNQGNQNF
jgi:hypothetical protein